MVHEIQVVDYQLKLKQKLMIRFEEMIFHQEVFLIINIQKGQLWVKLLETE